MIRTEFVAKKCLDIRL